MARFTATTAPLAANGVYTSDILNITSEDAVTGTITASHAGTLNAEFSGDGGKTWSTKETFPVAAATPVSIRLNTSPPMARLRYVNGATAQSSFTLTFRASDPGSRNPTSSRNSSGPKRVLVTGSASIAAATTVQGISAPGVNTQILPPASSSAAGRILRIKDEGGNAATNVITVARTGIDTIDAGTSVTIASNYGIVRLYSDGATKWFTC